MVDRLTHRKRMVMLLALAPPDHNVSHPIFIHKKTFQVGHVWNNSDWERFPPHFSEVGANCVLCGERTDYGGPMRERMCIIGSRVAYACNACFFAINGGTGRVCEKTIQLPLVCRRRKRQVADTLVLCLLHVGMYKDLRQLILKIHWKQLCNC